MGTTLLLVVLAVRCHTQAAPSNNCGAGNSGREACRHTVPAAGGVGTGPCCWTTNGEKALCLGIDVAASWASGGAGDFACSTSTRATAARSSVRGLVGLLTGLFGLRVL